MKSDITIWRDVESQNYLLDINPNNEILVLTDICLRLARAREIRFERPHFLSKNPEWRLSTANEKAIKFCFIGGY